jgi:hypothetical protein
LQRPKNCFAFVWNACIVAYRREAYRYFRELPGSAVIRAKERTDRWSRYNTDIDFSPKVSDRAR